MLHYFNISKFGNMFFHWGRSTQCLSWSSVHWSFRKLPFTSLRKKKSANGLGLSSSYWKREKFQFFVVSNLCASHLETDKSLCLEQEINRTGCQYCLFPRLTIDCITSLEISFHFFFLPVQ